MRIYLAARYSRRRELKTYRKELEEAGHAVTSRWLNGHHRIGHGLPRNLAEGRFAVEDHDDVCSAQVLIAFSEEPRSSATRGGRHVETGLALGLGKPVIVVGPVENVFHRLPAVVRLETWGPRVLQLLDRMDGEGCF